MIPSSKKLSFKKNNSYAMVARLKTAMNNSSLDSECDICWYYLVSPNLSIRREDKCSLFMFSMPAIFINHYPSPFSDLSSALKNLSVFSFLLMKTNPHLLLFLPTLSQPLIYRTKSASNIQGAHKP